MLQAPLRYLATLSLVCVLSSSVSAQQQTGGTTGQTGTIGQTGTNGTTGIGEPTMGGTLDADTIFSSVERGTTVGEAPAAVGGDAGAAAGAGGLGGLGGLGGGAGGLGGFGGLGGLFGGLGGTTQSTQPVIRTRLRSAVTVAPMSARQVQTNSINRFRSLPNNPGLNRINVTVRDQTAVISGSVRSERDRRMSELLMRLEPGVRSVENRIVVMP